MRSRRLVLLACLALLSAACRESDLVLGGPGFDPPPVGDPTELLSDPDEVVALALEDLNRFWTRELPEVYDVAFTPLRGGYVPYGPVSPLPECGDERLRYEDIAENALYCPASDVIAWDREALIPRLQEQFGSLTTGVVMAHEFAHAIQVRGGVDARTLTLELQADCFAGAWVGDVHDRIATFSTDGEALELALAGLLELRDTVGVSARDDQAHGSGFDRIGALLDGVERGAVQCATYEADPPITVAIPFSSLADARQGGNLPLDQLIDPLVADLESYFGALFTARGRVWDSVDDLVAFDPADGAIACGGVRFSPEDLAFAAFHCESDDTLYLDVVELVPALDEIGDFAFGGELARLYATAAQSQLGIRATDVDGLHANCLTGSYAAAEFARTIPDQQLVLSPGDLDEIIISFLALGEPDGPTAFDRTAAFRVGFLDGDRSCDVVYL